MMGNTNISVVDLAPFLTDGDGDGDGDDDFKKNKVAAMGKLAQICSEDGFFQVINHGIPLTLMTTAMELSKTFFALPPEDKLKSTPLPGATLPVGYNFTPTKEDFFMCPPGRTTYSTVFPTNPPEFREIMEELFNRLTEAGQFLEGIISECLGLPPNFLKEFNNDRSADLMLAFCYASATETDNTGAPAHQDGNSVTFVLQDDVGGLEVLKNGQWIPITPVEGSLVVNIGDCIQVLSNKKFKSNFHRVVRSRGRSRYSIVFFYDLDGDKWVEPLPQFTQDVGMLPKYRGFFYKEYKSLRIKQKNYPPSRAAERVGISHFEIPT